jgi:hypothetical protein
MSRFITQTVQPSIHEFVGDVFNATTIAVVGVLGLLTVFATV